MTLNNLNDLYLEELRDLYDAENQLLDALEEMESNATHAELRKAFQEHRQETETHVERLEKIFKRIGEDPEGETCEAMEGMIAEAQELLEKDADDDVLDAAMIAAAQRVEHYEISGYGTVATYAETLGHQEDHKLLSETLSEEKAADEKLNKIAKQIVNPDAVAA